MKILWIALVWPEPDSSAAGLRTRQLIDACRQAGHEVLVTSPCQYNSYQRTLESEGFPTQHLPPNDAAFDVFISQYNPQIVVFDRFMIEEQFSWRVRSVCPDAVRLLDTIDLHSLRKLRQEKVGREENPFELKPIELHSETFLRELSAILRSDCSLIISPFEYEFLATLCHVPERLLALCLPFYDLKSSISPFASRSNCVIIGNANHPPNADSLQILKTVVWPKVSAKLLRQGIVKPEVHIYGSHLPNKVLAMHDAKSGFCIKGKADDAQVTLGQYRINLAPLRFGAGIKGKICDGWAAGTPSVATAIAAEGMIAKDYSGNELFGGFIAGDWDDFASKVSELYCEETKWYEAQGNGAKVLFELFNRKKNIPCFLDILKGCYERRSERRSANLNGALLWQQQMRSTEYFSRWIEEKNASRAKNVEQ